MSYSRPFPFPLWLILDSVEQPVEVNEGESPLSTVELYRVPIKGKRSRDLAHGLARALIFQHPPLDLDSYKPSMSKSEQERSKKIMLDDMALMSLR